MATLHTTYHEAQHKVFFECGAKHRIVQKGGRVGFTRGGATFFVEKMATSPKPLLLLWGDETLVNVRKYYHQYFRPLLLQISPDESPYNPIWHWNKQESELRIGNSVCHFRSADRPYRWEGFGYHYIFLNEAGLILRNPYIWEQAVQKTMLDYKDSVLIAAGVPKGYNKFTEMIEMALDPRFPDWEHFHFSTHDNPFIPTENIVAMEDRDPKMARQEIYGEILGEEDSAFQFIKPAWVDLAFNRWNELATVDGFQLPGADAFGADPSGGGDEAVLTSRHGLFVPPQLVLTDSEASDTVRTVSRWRERICEGTGKQPHEIRTPIRIDYIGVGKGVHDLLKKEFSTVIGLTGGGSSNKKSSDGIYRMYNDMTWWWWYVGEMLNPLSKWHKPIAIAPDPVLKKQLCSVWYVINGDTIRREPKDKTKSRLNGKSPDRAESFVYAWSDFKGKSGKFGIG